MRFIGVGGQGTLREMGDFIRDFEMDGFDHIADPRATIWQAFQITAQPSFVFINDDGTITRQIGGLGYDDLDATLQDLIAG